ncbi:hypothetical protein GCM10008942_02980 [Rhizomicrobium electricum]|uniref:Uncharacterized protein n=1 Tax=Rhizomicrobium electricum TaxID=480070 RepID=A0ABN1E494_9PROT
MLRHPGRLGRRGAGFRAHQMVEFQGQIALVVLGIKLVQPLRADQTEHPVAEEFEPFVGVGAARAGVGKRPCQQFLVGKKVAKAFFQLSRPG